MIERCERSQLGTGMVVRTERAFYWRSNKTGRWCISTLNPDDRCWGDIPECEVPQEVLLALRLERAC